MTTIEIINEQEQRIDTAFETESFEKWAAATRSFAFFCVGALSSELDAGFKDTREKRLREIFEKEVDRIIASK